MVLFLSSYLIVGNSMYYTFGKTDNRMHFDKNNRLGLDASILLSKSDELKFDGLTISFVDAEEEVYLPKGSSVKVDGVEVTNKGPSCFYKKKDMLDMADGIVCFNGKLIKSKETLDLSNLFVEAFDYTDDLNVYVSNQNIFSATFGSSKLNFIQYIVNNPIKDLKINKALYNNIYIISRLYVENYVTRFKIYCIK